MAVTWNQALYNRNILERCSMRRENSEKKEECPEHQERNDNAQIARDRTKYVFSVQPSWFPLLARIDVSYV